MTNGDIRYIFNTINDVDIFTNKFNHDNNYSGLNVGDTIIINDGTYNVDWLIAGFDCEKSRIASDDTTYDNGYGIALVPKTYVSSDSYWNTSNTLVGAYYSSYIRNTTLPTIATNLQSILGSHLINRNVLLSNSIDSDSHSNGYTWTNDYATLMSGTQLGKEIATTRNKYDDGEANYKLDLFSDYTSRKTGSNYWVRGVWGRGSYGDYYAWHVYTDGTFAYYGFNKTFSVRPFIYIR